MLRSKENTNTPLYSEFIQYLYAEYKRKSTKNYPNILSEILSFIKSPDGQKAYHQFLSLDRSALGVFNKTIHRFTTAGATIKGVITL